VKNQGRDAWGERSRLRRAVKASVPLFAFQESSIGRLVSTSSSNLMMLDRYQLVCQACTYPWEVEAFGALKLNIT